MVAGQSRAASADAGPRAPDPRSRGGATHGHLWTLLDGTAAHARPGALSYDEDGRPACHLCGAFFVHLGAHLRAHGWSAAQYREAVGLAHGQPLCCRALSTRIAARQRRSYRRDVDHRRRLEQGHELARSGELTQLSRLAKSELERSGGEPAPLREARTRRLDRGRATQAQRRRTHVEDVVRRAGAADLHDYLRRTYAAGESLNALRETLMISRARLRSELEAAGVRVRPTGHNVIASRQRRAGDADAAAAARVGVADIRAWLHAERAAGGSIAALAAQSGRSDAWVRSRLRGTVTTSPSRARRAVARTSDQGRRTARRDQPDGLTSGCRTA